MVSRFRMRGLSCNSIPCGITVVSRDVGDIVAQGVWRRWWFDTGSTSQVKGAGFCIGSVRGKFDVMRVPPWKRWPKDGLLRIHLSKLPEVEPQIDVLACSDPALVADAVCEVVPWKRKWKHHEWLHALCSHLRTLLPQMSTRDLVRVILAFGELHTKRKVHSLLFNDYETFSLFFQALPVEAANEKTLVPLIRTYHRMDVKHEPFVRAACERVVTGEVELMPTELVELVRLHGHLKFKNPRLFEFAAEVLDLRFAYFSEDQVGDLARTFCQFRYNCSTFLAVLRRELPFRLHEYAWWNLIDLAELYLELQLGGRSANEDRELIQRIGNEAFKLVFSMKYGYTAKALKVLAFLETSDKRTFRLLVRSMPRHVCTFSPQVAAETILACAAVDVQPRVVYHRLRGERLYRMLVHQLTRSVSALSAKMVCDVFAALARVSQPESELASAVEDLVMQRPFKFHAEHLISLLRDFGILGFRSPELRELFVQRHEELSVCTPSALCAVPGVLASHPRRANASVAGPVETAMLDEVTRLLCKRGAYKLPQNPNVFRGRDDLWFQQLRNRHFRLRRRAKLMGTAVASAPQDGDASANAVVVRGSSGSDPSDEEDSPAVVHVTKKEYLLLVDGCRQLDWRDMPLLEGVVAWICAGRRHAELLPAEVALLLRAFSSLGFVNPLLRAALEHALLRVAPELSPVDCAGALTGAVDLGMRARSAAVRALLRRCTSQLALMPESDSRALSTLSSAVVRSAEQEVETFAESNAVTSPPLASMRMPLELHLFSEALSVRLGERRLLR